VLRAIAFILALLMVLPVSYAATPITWDNLRDPSAAKFDDPFAALSGFELRSLGTVLRLRQRLAEEDVAAEARPRIEQRLRTEEAKLASAGVRTDWLLEQRLEIGKKRAAAALAGNPQLEGKDVAITGYVIPVAGPDGKTTTGYLVPEAGMCSHMPAPDPNQMIRYRLLNNWEAGYVYEPVLLTGTLSLKTTRQEIMLLDGQVDMLAAFEMMVTDVRSLDQTTGPEPENRLLRLFRNFKRQGDAPRQ